MVKLSLFTRGGEPPNDTASELRQVQAAKRGDRAAFDTLVCVHEVRLRAFIARRVGPDMAEDIAQDTLLAAWQAIPKLDLRVRFKTWLYQIAVHKCADHFRAQGRRSQAETPLDDARLPADPYSSGFTADTERRAIVQEVFNHLSDDQRQLLEMYYFAELTLPEIAVALNRNLNTVKYQFYRVHAVAAERCAELGEAALSEATSAAPVERMVYGR